MKNPFSIVYWSLINTFELHRFLKNKYIVSTLYLQVLYICIQQTVDVNPQIQRADCMHYSVQFYIRDMNICEFYICKSPGTNSPQIRRNNYSSVFEKLKVIHEFLNIQESAPLILILFKGELYYFIAVSLKRYYTISRNINFFYTYCKAIYHPWFIDGSLNSKKRTINPLSPNLYIYNELMEDFFNLP